MTRGYWWVSALAAIISLIQTQSASAQAPEKSKVEVKSAQLPAASPAPDRAHAGRLP